MPQFQMRVPCTAATKRFQIPAVLQQIVAEVQQRAIAGESATECNAMQLNQYSAVQQGGSTMECSATGWSAVQQGAEVKRSNNCGAKWARNSF